MPRSSKLSRIPRMRLVPTATNTTWPIQSSGPYIIASPIACVLAVPYPYTLPAAHREAVKRRQARYKLPQLAHHVDRHAFELPLARVGDVLLLRYGVLPGPHPEARGEEEVVVLAFLGSTICSIVKPGALCTFPLPRAARLFPFLYLRPWVAWDVVERRPKETIARIASPGSEPYTVPHSQIQPLLGSTIQ